MSGRYFIYILKREVITQSLSLNHVLKLILLSESEYLRRRLKISFQLTLNLQSCFLNSFVTPKNRFFCLLTLFAYPFTRQISVHIDFVYEQYGNGSFKIFKLKIYETAYNSCSLKELKRCRSECRRLTRCARTRELTDR